MTEQASKGMVLVSACVSKQGYVSKGRVQASELADEGKVCKEGNDVSEWKVQARDWWEQWDNK